MKIFRLVTIATFGLGISVSSVFAQIQEQQPAEFPPTSYKGKQYVDSKGCVFIRAGIDGDVSWIPRVTRSRKTICGFAPTLAGAQQAAPAPASSAPAAAPVQITLNDTAAPAAPAVAAKPQARKAAAPAAPRQVAKPRVVRQVAPQKPIVQQVAPAPVVVASTPAPQPVRRTALRRQVQTACPGASPLSQQYLRGDGRSPVRCGPQSEPIVGFQRGATTRRSAALPQVSTTVAPVTVTAQTRVVPKHVAINRINTQNVTVPRGYKRAWEDDRLNPKRAEQTLGGRSEMLLIWTNTVPRRLVNQATGRDVTASVPLVYPYLDIPTQQRELGEVTLVQRDGQLVKRILRNKKAKRVTYSSRSAPNAQAAPQRKVRATPAAPASKPAVDGKRYVQIGYFSTAAKAQKAAQYLAGMGMRARIGKVRKGSKTYLAVQAGPFSTGAATSDALARLRGVGYSSAFARN